MTNKNIGGVIIINKKNELKQIIMDFESSSLEEFYTQKTKVSLFKHIKNEDPINNLVLTYEITNFLNNREEFNTYYTPSLFEFIKCVIHSIYRNIFFHIVITSSGNIFVLSICFCADKSKKHPVDYPIKSAGSAPTSPGKSFGSM